MVKARRLLPRAEEWNRWRSKAITSPGTVSSAMNGVVQPREALAGWVLAEVLLDQPQNVPSWEPWDHPERASVDGSGLQMDEELDAADVGAAVVVPSRVRGEARGDRRCGNGGSARQRDGPLVEAGIVGD